MRRPLLFVALAASLLAAPSLAWAKKTTPSHSHAKTQHRPSTKKPSVKKSPGREVHVRGYTRKDGTYVAPHTRSAPK